MMIAIQELGEKVDRVWRRANYSEAEFSAIATEALHNCEVGGSFFREVTEWALADHGLPRQLDIEASFGQPPLVLYINPLQTFFIQALIWLDSTTAVHQHVFSGAFKVVEGESLHSRYAFTPGLRVNSRMLFGELAHLESEVLGLGTVRPIEVGESLIHSVFHLEEPSVTVVVRTFGEASRTPQYEYLRPCLAVDPFYKSERLQRNLQVLGAVSNVDRKRYVQVLRELLAAADLYTAYRYIRHFQESRPSEDERDEMASVTKHLHGELGAKIFHCLEQAGRDAFLIAKRRALKAPDHRFYLALLLNVPRRATILQLIERRFQRDPIALVEEWTDQLCAGDDPALVSLDEPTRLVFKSMLRGVGFDGVVQHLSAEFSEEDVREQLDELRYLYDTLQGQSYFGPVLRA